MTLEIIVLEDAAAVAAEAARHIAAAAAEAQAARGMFRWALAGGETPRATYLQLAQCTDLDWSRVEVFWGDERAVPRGAPESNAGMAAAALLQRVPIPADRVHPMPIEPGVDLDAAARAYEALLRARCGDPPRLDLVLLGLGRDAHTASLFPRSAALRAADRLVVAVPEAPIAPRLTLTLEMLSLARAAVLVVTGAEKAGAVARVLDGPRAVDSAPAQGLRAARVTWLLDRSAAADRRAAAS